MTIRHNIWKTVTYTFVSVQTFEALKHYLEEYQNLKRNTPYVTIRYVTLHTAADRENIKATFIGSGHNKSNGNVAIKQLRSVHLCE
jgi:hypothetical protein